MDNHEEKTRIRAYELWEQAGKPADQDMNFWDMAEKELAGNALDSELEDSFPASDPPSSTMRS